MRNLQRRTISLRLLFFCFIIGILLLHQLQRKAKTDPDAEIAKNAVQSKHVETDLERRLREEQELGHSLWPYVEYLKNKALRPPSKDEMLRHATKGLCAIDPYSKCVSEKEYQEEQTSRTSNYVGIGVVLAHNVLGALIRDIRIKSPAEKAGLSIGDIITHIIVDGQKLPFAGLNEEEQLHRLEGMEGTTLSLVLLRKNRVIVFPPILRVSSVTPTVEKVHFLAPHYGYFHVKQFSTAQTGSEILYAVERLKQKGRLRGLVIDLRGNLGGGFLEAVDMAGFFLDGGVVVTTFSRAAGRKSYEAPRGDILFGAPIVILVDKESASSSEVFAGALVDREPLRAILMGEKTYGKGVGQTTEAGPGGGMVTITSFEFFTPKGNAVHGKGFTPDPSLLEIFKHNSFSDPWEGAALNYLQFMDKKRRTP